MPHEYSRLPLQPTRDIKDAGKDDNASRVGQGYCHVCERQVEGGYYHRAPCGSLMATFWRTFVIAFMFTFTVFVLTSCTFLVHKALSNPEYSATTDIEHPVARWFSLFAGVSEAQSESLANQNQNQNQNQNPKLNRNTLIQSRPIVVWHGLGDSYSGLATKMISEAANAVLKTNQSAVYGIRLDDDVFKDTEATAYGWIQDQLDYVCHHLSNVFKDTEIDGIGLSQGGLFLRGLAEQCPTLRMHTLVTVGSPHQGIWGVLPSACNIPYLSVFCRWSYVLPMAYARWIQHRFVPTTYLKLPEHLDAYRSGSTLLAPLNNEDAASDSKTALARKSGLLKLKMLVLVRHSDDHVLFPRDSAWFGDTTNGTRNVVPVRQSNLYLNDTIGLRTLDKTGRLAFEEFEGEHMQFSLNDMKRVIQKYNLGQN